MASSPDTAENALVSDIKVILGHLSTIFFPPEVRTVFTGDRMTATTPEFSSAALTGTNFLAASNLQTHRWSLFLDDKSFEKAFGNQINKPTSWTVYYKEKGDTSYTPVTTKAALHSATNSNKELVDINFSSFLVKSLFRTTSVSLWHLLNEITILANADYSIFNRQAVPKYDVNATTNAITYFNLNLSAPSHQAYFTPYLRSWRLIADSTEDLRERVNFYVFRRLMFLLKQLIHIRIAKILDLHYTPTNPSPNDPSLDAFTNAVTQIMANNTTEFDSTTSDEYNFGNFHNETQSIAIDYYKGTGVVKDLNVEYEKVKQELKSEQAQRLATKKLTAYSIVLLIIACIVFACAIGALGYAFMTMNGSALNVSVMVFASSLVVSIAFYMVTNWYQLEPFYNMPPNVSASAGQYITGSMLRTILATRDMGTSQFNYYVYTYLQQTYKAASVMQTRAVFENAKKIQDNDMKTLQQYKGQLGNLKGELEVANNIVERKQRNNVAVAWFLLGIMMITSGTMILHAALEKVPLARLIVDIAGAMVLFGFTMIMLFFIFSRTRRDPSKFYWFRPPYSPDMP